MSERGDLPTGFKSKIERMNDYYRQKTRVLPVSGAGVPVNAGDLSIFHLPAASLLDLSTFSLHFTGQLNGIAANQPAGFPKDIDTLIDILSIYINGTQIAYIQNYGNLWRILNDYNLSSEAESKNMPLYNSDPSIGFSMTDTGAITKYIKHANASATMPVEAANSSGFYSISRWIGFLGNKMANIIDTNLCGTIEIRIQWAQPWVLWGNTATKPTGYTLNNLTAYVDRIQWNNQHFEAVLNGILTGAGTMTIPYNNFRYHGGQFLNTSKSVVFRFQELSHSINGLLISFTDPDPNTIDALQLANNVTVVSNSAAGIPAAADLLALSQNANQIDAKYFSYDKCVERGDYPLLNTSKYFRRNGLGLGAQWDKDQQGCFQLMVNGQQNPSYKMTLSQIYEMTLEYFGINNVNNQEGINPGLRSMQHFERDYFVIAYPLKHLMSKDDDKDYYLISGLNSQATSVEFAAYIDQVRATNAAHSGQIYAFSSMDSLLKIHGGRAISVEY